MAGSMNKAILIGNVGGDPDIRATQTGKKIANFSVATSESWKDRDSGERKERTEWHRVVCFNEGIAGVVERYVKKGSKVCVEGAIRTRKWTDQAGQERFTTEVVIEAFNGSLVLLGDPGGDRRDGGDGGYAPPRAERTARAPATGRPGSMSDSWKPPPADDLDDEIPF